jgi:hypothetical protein
MTGIGKFFGLGSPKKKTAYGLNMRDLKNDLDEEDYKEVVRRVEKERVEEKEPDWGSMDEMTRRMTNYSQNEKKQMMEIRDLLKYVPTGGNQGSVQTQIARDFGVTPQYVRQIFFPNNPQRLFSARSENVKQLWISLVDIVNAKRELAEFIRDSVMDVLKGEHTKIRTHTKFFKYIRRRLKDDHGIYLYPADMEKEIKMPKGIPDDKKIPFTWEVTSPPIYHIRPESQQEAIEALEKKAKETNEKHEH